MLDESWAGELTIPDTHYQKVTMRVSEHGDYHNWVWDDTDEPIGMNTLQAYILGLRLPAEIYPIGAKIHVTLEYERPTDDK